MTKGSAEMRKRSFSEPGLSPEAMSDLSSSGEASDRTLHSNNYESLLLKKKSKTLDPVNASMKKIKTISLDSPAWQYNFIYQMCVLMLISGTVLWRLWGLWACGSFCELNAQKENDFFKYAKTLNGYDYMNFPGLHYPAGIVYFYRGLNWIIERIPADKMELFKQALPMAIYCYFLFLINLLMKKSRIPAPFLLFFVFPGGLLMQGHGLMFVLPETLGLVWLLQALTALLGGYHTISVISLGMGLVFDFVVIFPVLPAFSLCLMRSMGARWTLLWIGSILMGFTLISSRFLLSNPIEYLTQALGLQVRTGTWNPLIWWVHWIEEALNLKVMTRNRLETIVKSIWSGIILQISAQFIFTNFRWLRADEGIFGLCGKFMKSNRGHGIRPTPWTPRQTLTVVFESLLLSVILRFPSLVHAEEFELILVLLSGFFCIGLADRMPIPAVYGLFAALSFPLTFLYRTLQDDGSIRMKAINNLHFHLGFRESLHFLPMLLLPVVQLIILLGLKRRDISVSFSFSTSCASSAQIQAQNLSNNSLNSSNSILGINKGVSFVSTHHRRSSSLSRRKVD